MPLTKVHVECGVIVETGKSSDLFFGVWSETIDVGATTTKVASRDNSGLQDQTGRLVFRVRAPTAAEIFGAEGVAPNAGASVSTSEENNRAHLAAGELRDIPTRAGAKFATAAVA